ncbi:MAG: transcriptional repressor [candidate division Zixibacteria bacterium]|nr:transcriptional repressor [candidate division Zixibacteria bacterium]
MREFLRTKGYKMTPQRELIFRSFFEMDKHVSVDEVYDRVRRKDTSVGYSTVWRNLKLICQVGLAQEVKVGDGVTRYDRVTKAPHGHLYCLKCRSLVEFEAGQVLDFLTSTAGSHDFSTEGFKIEIQGYCSSCRQLATHRLPIPAADKRADKRHVDEGPQL